MTKENILIIKHGSLGDMIRISGIIESIKGKHKNANLILLTTNSFRSLMDKNPYIDEIIIDDRKPFYNFFYYLKLKKRINKFSFQKIYDLQNSQRTSIYKKIFLNNITWISTNMEKHPISGIQGLIDMLHKHKIPTINAFHPNLDWMKNDIHDLLVFHNLKSGYILMIPGSSKAHKEKRWPFFPELVNLLLTNNYQVVTVLGPDELDLKEKIPGIVLKNLSWGDLTGVIDSSSAIVSNDTGPIHIAACLKKKGIILFGPTTSSIRTSLNDNNFKIITTQNLQTLNYKDVFNELIKVI